MSTVKYIQSVADLKSARRLHEVELGDGVAVKLRMPTVAQAAAMSSCEDSITALSSLLVDLLVKDDGSPLFADAAEIADAMAVDQLVAIADYITDRLSPKSAEKN